MDKIFRIVLSIIFLASGIAKLFSLDYEVAAFARWGYPAGFMYFIGIMEVAGALGLWLRKLSALAGFCLCVLMSGAIATHAMHAEWPMVAAATGLLFVTASYTWRQRRNLLPSDHTPPSED